MLSSVKCREIDKNNIFDGCVELVSNSFNFARTLVEDKNDMDTTFALKSSCDYISTQLLKSSSTYKREKVCKENIQYVAPITKAVGTRWEMRALPNTPTKYPQRVQNTLQYISITETIRKLFQREDFRKEYFEYNYTKSSPDAHVCKKGVFRGFCCGRLFQDIKLFKDFPESVQIQISSDDCEIASPLKSHASVYKISPVYFSIKNMPSKFLSKTSNIFLVAICYADDLKTKETDFNNIWRLIVNDISYMETIGIDVTEDLNIKGTLVSCVFDNLGTRIALGFIESFNTKYYCFICEMPKSECKFSTKTNNVYNRSVDKYKEHLDQISKSTEIDFLVTKGVKRYCVLNDLNYFHISKNKSLDIMHDNAEGTIMFSLKELFGFCIAQGIITEKTLVEKIKYFNFGSLSESNRPSILNLKKENLNQNASQSKCLFENIPFILWELQNNKKIKKVWVCIESLLRIIQTIYSWEITESDLQNLENDIHIHLQNFQKVFGKTLKPKQHNIIHYPDMIRTMGPLIHLSMMRYEAKHKEFKGYVTNNFMNIPKSLAKKHQEQLLTKMDSYKDGISYGVLTRMKDISEEKKIIISNYFKESNIIETTKWLQYHSSRFEPGLKILYESKIYEITEICYTKDSFYFFCTKYSFIKFHKFSNSLQIKISDPIEFKVIPFNGLISYKSFESIKMGSEIYIKATTLEFRKLYT